MVADIRSEDGWMEGSFVRGRCEGRERSTIRVDRDQFPGFHVRCQTLSCRQEDALRF